MSHGRARVWKHALYYLLDISALLLMAVAMIPACNALFDSQLTLPPLLPAIALMFIGLPLGHLAVGLYDSKLRENIRNVFRRTVISAALVFGTMQVLYFMWSPEPLVLEHTLATLGGSIVLQTLWRYWVIFHGGLQFARRKILVLGSGQRAAFVAKRMRRDTDRKHFQLLGFLPINNDHQQDPSVLEHETLLSRDDHDDWAAILEHYDADIIVIAKDRHQPHSLGDDTALIKALLDCKMNGTDVVELEDFVEAELGQLAVENMRPEWLLSSKGFHFNRWGTDTFNYLFNALLAGVVLLLTWPLMLLAALAIYLDDGRRDKASVFYKQIRVGLDGKPFEILKFRSMGKNAEKNGAQWAQKNDVRVTRIGGFLRKYRIDELPQLLNVLRGDMGFVGPRPERPEFVSELAEQIPFFDYRHRVKPGLTGWAQLKYPYGASCQDSLEKLKFDLYYVKHRSFLLDLFVLVRTVEIVLFGRGR